MIYFINGYINVFATLVINASDNSHFLLLLIFHRTTRNFINVDILIIDENKADNILFEAVL